MDVAQFVRKKENYHCEIIVGIGTSLYGDEEGQTDMCKTKMELIGSNTESLGEPFVKRFALCYWTVVLSVCNVGVLWPNGSLDQAVTWYGGRPQSRPHCVRWGPSSPFPLKGAQQPPLLAHFALARSLTSATAELLFYLLLRPRS